MIGSICANYYEYKKNSVIYLDRHIPISRKSDYIISIAKAIGIALMVLSHAGLMKYGRSFISMFHMPLFFICSGYCFNYKYIKDFGSYFLRKINTLYMPFVKWGLLFLILHNGFYYLNIYSDQFGYNGEVSHLFDAKEIIYHALHTVLFVETNEMLLGGYWFIHTLFFASFISYAFFRYLKSCIIGSSILLLISVLLRLGNICIPYANVGYKEFLAASFILVGKVLYKYKVTYNYSLLLCFVVVVLVASIIMPLNMTNLGVYTIIPYFIVAIIGSMLVLGLASFCPMPIRSALTFVGNHTLEILTWHFLAFKVVSLFIIWIENRPLSHLAYFPVIPSLDNLTDQLGSEWCIMYFISGLTLPLIFCLVKERILSKG